MNRRQFFLRGSAAAASARFAWAQDLLGSKPKRVGLIGTGWYGKCDLIRLIQVAPVEVVSLCDVDRRMLEAAARQMAARQESGKMPRLYSDYRAMLKERDLDIVLIATPDHWHALPMIEAVKAGADVYTQKPISLDVLEGQAMVAAARKYGRVVQVGTQRRSTPHLADAIERIIAPGKLGKIGQVEIYCYYHMRNRTNPPDAEAPSYLDWEAYTGPARMRPYNQIVHPRGWRNFTEYSNGIVGDMCIHMLDAVRWMLKLGWPKSVSSQGGILVQKDAKANTPDTQTAVFEFPEFPVVWTHRTWGSTPDPQYPWGGSIYGEKGTLRFSVMGYDFQPLDKSEAAVHKDVTYELEEYPEDKTERDLEKHVAPAIRYHMKDMLKAIAERGKPVADIEQGHISTASCILANIALATGRTLRFDPAKHIVTGDAEATQMLARPYREGYEHPAAGKV